MAEAIYVEYPTIVSKIQGLYDDEDTKDVSFNFEGSDRIIKAHKFLLEIASLRVFERMFSGRFSEKDSITIRQMRPEIFEMVIYASYLKPITLTNVDDALELYNAALMYDIQDLRDKARSYMELNVYWNNAIYVFDNVEVFGLNNVQYSCRVNVMEKYDYQTLISHLFRDEEISEKAFIAAAEHWKGEHLELYQILEVYVELGKLKTYSKAIGLITFMGHSIEDVLSAKLFTDEEKIAIIANLQADEARFKPFIEIPDHLSKKPFVHHRNSEARDFAHLIWIALLLACSENLEYFEFLLKKYNIVGGGFMMEGVYNKAFERVRKGERMIKSDFEYLFEEVNRFINVFDKYEVCYEETSVRLVEKEKEFKAELFRYEFKCE